MSDDPDTRRCVLSIWNADFDLATSSKDIPCNDLLMFKIRNGELYTTISNRSNDLHWGVPTNVFQFSVLTELLSNVLGISLAKQTHNSQSLHFYANNEIAGKMHKEYANTLGSPLFDIYDICEPSKMDFNFPEGLSNTGKLHYLDSIIHEMLKVLENSYDKANEKTIAFQKSIYEFELRLKRFSKYLYEVYVLLDGYIDYKNCSDKDTFRGKELSDIDASIENGICQDYKILAMNWYYNRIKNPEDINKLKYHKLIGKL